MAEHHVATVCCDALHRTVTQTQYDAMRTCSNAPSYVTTQHSILQHNAACCNITTCCDALHQLATARCNRASHQARARIEAETFKGETARQRQSSVCNVLPARVRDIGAAKKDTCARATCRAAPRNTSAQLATCEVECVCARARMRRRVCVCVRVCVRSQDGLATGPAWRRPARARGRRAGAHPSG
jgi:hypothetical protein